MSEHLPAKRRMNRIEEHGLEEQAITLLTANPRLSYEQIAEQLNKIAGLEDAEEKITKKVVFNYAKIYPEARREVLLSNRKIRRELVLEGAEFDMLKIYKDQAARLTFLIDEMEEEALNEGMLPDPKAYKALSSELRETLKQIEAIHKSVYDMEVVREFLKDVVETLKDISPEALVEFTRRMKMKRDSEHVVSEILKGGGM